MKYRKSSMNRSKLQLVGISLIFIVSLILIICLVLKCRQYEKQLELVKIGSESIATINDDDDDARFSRRLLSNYEELIFVGGVPRSGTTLMRAILDAHPMVRCGGETMMIPNFLTWQAGWRRNDWANNSGISNSVLDDAVSAFITEIIGKHDKMADRLCNKDPYTALWLPTLSRMFPNAKYILMIRDARAVIHSMIDRNVPVQGYNTSNEEQMFEKWNTEIGRMLLQCSRSAGQCIKVHYERLIQRPSDEIQRITTFLDLPYSEQMLRHHQLIGDEIALDDQEFSASQVRNSINLKPLTAWFDCFDERILQKLDKIAPFLSILGYDTSSSKPSYDHFSSGDFYRFGGEFQ